ncbi:hypothetical protein AMS68_000124 [Peltaster fructicola]|uniref:Extracellular membrane protein CFEM domain-containing protein n=1 Tax=Peltaster fructicola TaxID=286661 RepID=A0A6H0XIQ4_9PEZI|nr:hypothetical protein AMS68_000124 [Peltaster fructicola]
MFIVLFCTTVAVVTAQVLNIENAQFDINGCASVSGMNACYNKARIDLLSVAPACNGTNIGGTSCSGSFVASYYKEILECMTEACWNRAYNCDYQTMLTTFIESNYAGTNRGTPPFYVLTSDYGGVPGSCVCDLPFIQQLLLQDPSLKCGLDSSGDSCECCLIASRLWAIQTLCPSNSLAVLGLTSGTSYFASEIQKCSVFQQSNWNDTLQQQCPSYGIAAGVGFLNPMALPAGFPGTSSLSDTPGSVTAPSQYASSLASTFVHTWSTGAVSTYTFSSLNNAEISTTTGATTTTTTTNGQATTLSGSVATAVPSKTGAAERLAVPIGLLLGAMVL